MANKITVTSAGTVVNANVTPDSAMYYSNKSKEWAISNRIVDNTDYSSKYYANESKKQADISTTKATEVVESGNTAVSNIENAKDNAITSITNQENLSVDNVNTAGATQVALATEQATIATNKTSEVVASGNEALSNIDTAKSEALTEIETLHSSSVTDITGLKNTSITDITTAKDNAITTITTQETTSKNNVITTGNEQVDRVIATGNNYDNLTHKNITNCLLEVPQRIKYTLENGILTIKAGSVAIVPYGTEDLSSTYPVGSTFLNDNFKVYDTQYSDGKFFVWVEIVNDISTTGGTTATSMLWTLSVSIPNNKFVATFTSKAVVDTPVTYGQVYNTTTNVISTYGADSTVAIGTNISLPLLLVQSTANGYIVSMVYQVFNGFGYIGSTVWIDKGVKGLIPNGRNEDGTLKNIEITTNKIILKNYNTYTLDEYRTLFFAIGYKLSDSINFISGSLADRPVTLSTTKTTMYLCEDENIMYITSGSTTANWTAYKAMAIGNFNVTSKGVVASFNPKLPFRAVDYSDSSTVSSWGMPSGKYIDLTLGASGSTYTAPANGWFFLRKFTSASNQFIGLYQRNNDGVSSKVTNPLANFDSSIFIPVRKGQVVACYYSFGGETKEFRFIYAEGSK